MLKPEPRTYLVKRQTQIRDLYAGFDDSGAYDKLVEAFNKKEANKKNWQEWSKLVAKVISKDKNFAEERRAAFVGEESILEEELFDELVEKNNPTYLETLLFNIMFKGKMKDKTWFLLEKGAHDPLFLLKCQLFIKESKDWDCSAYIKNKLEKRYAIELEKFLRRGVTKLAKSIENSAFLSVYHLSLSYTEGKIYNAFKAGKTLEEKIQVLQTTIESDYSLLQDGGKNSKVFIRIYEGVLEILSWLIQPIMPLLSEEKPFINPYNEKKLIENTRKAAERTTQIISDPKLTGDEGLKLALEVIKPKLNTPLSRLKNRVEFYLFLKKRSDEVSYGLDSEQRYGINLETEPYKLLEELYSAVREDKNLESIHSDIERIISALPDEFQTIIRKQSPADKEPVDDEPLCEEGQNPIETILEKIKDEKSRLYNFFKERQKEKSDSVDFLASVHYEIAKCLSPSLSLEEKAFTIEGDCSEGILNVQAQLAGLLKNHKLPENIKERLNCAKENLDTIIEKKTQNNTLIKNTHNQMELTK